MVTIGGINLPFGNGGGGAFAGVLGSLRTIMIFVMVVIVVVSVVLVFVVRRRTKKAYNIPLIIITPRSDGRVVELNTGVGGYFKSKHIGGITAFRVKRPGIKMIEIPPPESVYLTSPNRTMLLVQKGMDDYEPVLPDSLGRVILPDGRKIAILDLKAKNQDATAWSFDNERTAKERYTLYTFWDKYKELISIMLVVFIMFLGMYITWNGLKEVAVILKDVADALNRATTNVAPEFS